MTVRVTESRLPAGFVATELGQTTTFTLPGGGKYILVSFLSSPLRPATVQEYVVFAIDADADEYRWTFPAPGGGAATNYTTPIGTVRHTFSDFGLTQVKVEVVLNGAVVATLNLLQGVAQPNPALEQAISQSATLMDRDSDVLRELWNDFNDYINLAADATGANGVPPRFVAAILDREGWGRPKIGTSGAADLIAADDAGHIRENEEDAMASAYQAGKPILGGSPFLGAPPIPASLGPGQIGQPTCAALEGMITWREGAAAGTTGLDFDRKFVMWLNATDFISIEYVKQVDVFNLTRFPKTNIKLLAKLLARLKNRPHRWPTVAKDDVIDTEKLVEIVATEYNIGPTATPAASAKPNMYGELHIKTRVDTPAPDFALFQ